MHQREIDSTLACYGPLATAWIPRDCEEGLYEIFSGQPAVWPAYNSWSGECISRGVVTTVFGPLIPPTRPEDFLYFARAEDLRAAGRDVGLDELGRSKQQIIAKIASRLPSDYLKRLRESGEERWTRFELRRASMTYFRVLHSTITAIICSQRDADIFRTAGIEIATWLSTGGNDDCEDCKKRDGKQGAFQGASDRPPLHPGCRCTLAGVLSQ